ncbi:MAG: PQQ-like beta-propeller repeat protein [Phycisphaeraceae bacterium]|nr:PQQ-like beta-propeller repeat protein [Phycisphaeraceae bacterium]
MHVKAMSLAWLAVLAGGVRAQEWTTLARSSTRDSRSDAAPAGLGPPSWIASIDESGRAITFEGQSGVVVHDGMVLALGRSGGSARLFCFEAAGGNCRWSAPVPAASFGSWTTPTVDPMNQVALVASAAFVTAVRLSDGALMWQTALQRTTAGATPVVTTDRGSADRAFVTDYDGFGGGGRMYCINVDPQGPGNPYVPGQIVWSVVIGSTSANTPAYVDGVVFVASASDHTGLGPGQIRAFDAGATSAPSPLWTFDNPAGHGYFGGVGVQDGAVYAASYAFAGGPFAANLVKVDAGTGELRWSIACNRTDTIPVRMTDGSIVVSGGIRGFGSIPSVQKFRDEGAAAVLEWDSALDSWVDLNSNSQMDPGEYVDVGGWTVQPVLSSRASGPALFVGVMPTGASTSSACVALRELDLAKHPAAAGFVRGSVMGMGSSPAMVGGVLYTIGESGLHAIGSVCYANCDQSNGAPPLTANDFQCFLNTFAAGGPYANCDGSTGTPILTANDFQCFLNKFAGGCP